MLPYTASRLSAILLFTLVQRVVFGQFVIKAINPTLPGQIGVNPVSVYGITTAVSPDDPIVTTTVIVPTATLTIVSPWAVVTETNGDVAFPATGEGKAALQSMFDQVAAACGGVTKRNRRSISRRSGSCELQQFQNLASSGGPLDFDIPGIEFGLGTFTAGDVEVILQGVPAAVAVAFIAYVIGNGKASDSVAPKVAASEIIRTATPSTTSSTKSAVPTTTPEDLLDNVYTAADEVYQSIAQVVLAQITADASADSVLWGLAPTAVPIPQATCDKSKVTNMESSVLKELATSFCTDLDLGKDNSRSLTNSDADTKAFEGYKFQMNWKSKGDCGGAKCEDIFSKFSTNCAYDRHSIYKAGTIDLACGSASFEIIPPEAAPPEVEVPAPTVLPEVSDKCVDSTVYTKFTRNEALDAIKDFCGHDINLPDAALPVWKTYRNKDVTLQLDVRWTISGKKGCNVPTQLNNHLIGEDCQHYFQTAIDNCNTDTRENKYGQKSLVWNSPNGCIDFEIYGDAQDWECGLGVQPLQCLGPPNNGIQLS